MALCCSKEMFMYDNYKILIVEAKEFLLDCFNITAEMVTNQNIDTRILTGIVNYPPLDSSDTEVGASG